MRRWGALGICTLALAAFAPAAASAFEPLSQFGSTGSGAAQLQEPTDVNTGPNGDLYVVDSANDRIGQFHLDGTLVRFWGFDVIPENGKEGLEACTTATGCKAGLEGAAAGQLVSPSGLATDADGDVYVADFTAQRIAHYTAEGAFVNAWGFDVADDLGGDTGFEVCTLKFGCQTGVAGGGPGQLTNPSDVAIVPGGDLYVTEANGQRVSQFTTAGKFVRAWGLDVIPANGDEGFEVCTTACKSGKGSGGGAGGVQGPRSVAAGKDGHLIVAGGYRRLSEYTPTGEFVGAWGIDVIPENGQEGFEVCTTATHCKEGKSATTGVAGETQSAFGVTATATGEVLSTDNGMSRVNRFTGTVFDNAFGFDVVTGEGTGFEICSGANCKVGTTGSGFGQFENMAGLAIDCRGAVWVSDRGGNDRLTRFGESGTPTTCTDPPAEEAKQLPPGGGTVTVKPSNGFTLGKAKLNRKKGTAKLPVDVPGAGVLALNGKGIKPVGSLTVSGPGRFQFPVDPTRKNRKALKKNGKATVTVTVTYTPTGGDPNSLRATVNLKMKEASKAATGKGR